MRVKAKVNRKAKAEAPTRPVSGTLTAGLSDSATLRLWQGAGLALAAIGPGDTASIKKANPRLRGGMKITDVRDDSPAAKAGLKAGDVLVGLHEWEMLSRDNVVFVVNHPSRATLSPVRFYIVRGGHLHRGWLALPD